MLKNFETRMRVEDFLFHEARLLDEWRLDEWYQLMAQDARYELPATDVQGDHSDTLLIISDDPDRLRQRVDQLLGNVMWCENPRSRTHRLISNVIVEAADDGSLVALANFIIHRFGNGRTDTFVGKYEFVLVPAANSFKIRRRTVRLDHESLFEHGKISIIL